MNRGFRSNATVPGERGSEHVGVLSGPPLDICEKRSGYVLCESLPNGSAHGDTRRSTV
jgi:hypothetical protein